MSEMIKINTRTTSSTAYREHLASSGIIVLKDWQEGDTHVFVVASPPAGYKYNVETNLPTQSMQQATEQEKAAQQKQAEEQMVKEHPLGMSTREGYVEPAAPISTPFQPAKSGLEAIRENINRTQPLSPFQYTTMSEPSTFRKEEAEKIRLSESSANPPPMILGEGSISTEYTENLNEQRSLAKYPSETVRESFRSLSPWGKENYEAGLSLENPFTQVMLSSAEFIVTLPAGMYESAGAIPISISESVGYATQYGVPKLIETTMKPIQEYPFIYGTQAVLTAGLIIAGGYEAVKGWRTMKAPTTEKPYSEMSFLGEKFPEPINYAYKSELYSKNLEEGSIRTKGTVTIAQKGSERMINVDALSRPNEEMVITTNLMGKEKMASKLDLKTEFNIQSTIVSEKTPEGLIKSVADTTRTQIKTGQMNLIGEQTSPTMAIKNAGIDKPLSDFANLDIARIGMKGEPLSPIDVVGLKGNFLVKQEYYTGGEYAGWTFRETLSRGQILDTLEARNALKSLPIEQQKLFEFLKDIETKEVRYRAYLTPKEYLARELESGRLSTFRKSYRMPENIKQGGFPVWETKEVQVERPYLWKWAEEHAPSTSEYAPEKGLKALPSEGTETSPGTVQITDSDIIEHAIRTSLKPSRPKSPGPELSMKAESISESPILEQTYPIGRVGKITSTSMETQYYAYPTGEKPENVLEFNPNVEINLISTMPKDIISEEPILIGTLSLGSLEYVMGEKQSAMPSQDIFIGQDVFNLQDNTIEQGLKVITTQKTGTPQLTMIYTHNPNIPTPYLPVFTPFRGKEPPPIPPYLPPILPGFWFAMGGGGRLFKIRIPKAFYMPSLTGIFSGMTIKGKPLIIGGFETRYPIRR